MDNIINKKVNAQTGDVMIFTEGVPGTSASIDSVEAVTLPAGSDATVENTGTAKNAHFVFGIPKGVSGNESIDDDAGEGDNDVVWSADKSQAEITHYGIEKYLSDVSSLINPWELGTIGATSPGEPKSSTKNARTPDFLLFDEDIAFIEITPKTGYYWSGRIYDAQTGEFIDLIAGPDSLGKWIDDTRRIFVDPSRKYKFVLKHSNGATMVIANLPEDVLSVKYYYRTDKSLSLSGKPADAEVTGEKINKIADANVYNVKFQWEFGSLLASNGENSSTNYYKRIRTTNHIKVEKDDLLTFESPSLYNVLVAEYLLEDSEFVFQGFIRAFTDTDTELVIKRDSYIRIVYKYADDRDIESTEFSDLYEKLTFTKYSPYADLHEDPFEVGTVRVDLSAGILHLNETYTRYRSRYLYNISRASLCNFSIDADDAENLSSVWFVFYNSDFSELLTEKIEMPEDETEFAVIFPENYPYMKVLLLFSEDVYYFRSSVELLFDAPVTTVMHPDSGQSWEGTTIAFNYIVSDKTMTSGHLILPPNYSMTGSKVPLVLFIHGSTGMTTWNADFQSGYKPYLRYLAKEGFAVFDCYPWTNNPPLEESTYCPFPIPAHKRSYLEGIRFVCSHYNVDINNVVLLCKSQGGYIGQWAIVQDDFPFKAVGLFAPSVDPVLHKTDQVFFNASARQALVKHIDFIGTDAEKEAFVESGDITNQTVKAFMDKNSNKVAALYPYSQGIIEMTHEQIYDLGLDRLDAAPQWQLDLGFPEWDSDWEEIPAFTQYSNFVKHGKRPSKFWGAFDDERTSTYANYAIYRYLLNGGSDSEFRILPNGTGGHNAMDTSATALRTDVTTRLGIAVTGVPVAYKEAVDFFVRNLAM